MTDVPASRALVVNPHAEMIERLDRISAPGKCWRSVGDDGQPNLPRGAYLLVAPEDSNMASAVGLAWAASMRAHNSNRRPSLVVDYAWEKDGLTAQIKGNFEIGLRDILCGATMMEDRVISGRYVDFLPVGRSPKMPPNEQELKKFSNLLGLLKTTYEYVIILSENPLRLDEVVQLGRSTNGVLLAVELNVTDRSRLEIVKKRFEEEHVPVRGVLAWRNRTSAAGWLAKLVNE